MNENNFSFNKDEKIKNEILSKNYFQKDSKKNYNMKSPNVSIINENKYFENFRDTPVKDKNDDYCRKPYETPQNYFNVFKNTEMKFKEIEKVDESEFNMTGYVDENINKKSVSKNFKYFNHDSDDQYTNNKDSFGGVKKRKASLNDNHINEQKSPIVLYNNKSISLPNRTKEVNQQMFNLFAQKKLNYWIDSSMKKPENFDMKYYLNKLNDNNNVQQPKNNAFNSQMINSLHQNTHEDGHGLNLHNDSYFKKFISSNCVKNEDHQIYSKIVSNDLLIKPHSHNLKKGYCSCKLNECFKNYCWCFKNKKSCSIKCTCINCRNFNYDVKDYGDDHTHEYSLMI